MVASSSTVHVHMYKTGVKDDVALTRHANQPIQLACEPVWPIIVFVTQNLNLRYGVKEDFDHWAERFCEGDQQWPQCLTSVADLQMDELKL